MKHVELNQGGLNGQLNKWAELLKNIKVRKSKTLFPIPLNWKNLKEYRCPVCNNKLLYTRDGSHGYCKGKRHLDDEKIFLPSQKIEEIRSHLC